MSVLCYSKNDIAFSIIIRFVIHKTNPTLQELGEEGRCYWRQILPRKSRIFFFFLVPKKLVKTYYMINWNSHSSTLEPGLPGCNFINNLRNLGRIYDANSSWPYIISNNIYYNNNMWWWDSGLHQISKYISASNKNSFGSCLA